ncbi:MAG: DUF5684 domain-containing protein [Actinomycetota bacterium]
MLAQFDEPGFSAPGPFFWLIWLAVVIVTIAGMWKTFEKAGKPGWAAIIPIYNIYVILQLIGKPWWWLLLLLIPLVNIILIFVIYIALAKAFGKGAGFGVGLALLSVIFFPLLGFGDAQYQGAPAAG